MTREAIIALLTRRGQTVAFAESLTGGLACDQLIRIPGASACVRGGVVAYQDQIKIRALGVSPETLLQRTAVSDAVAEQMAVGVERLMNADYAVSTTGYAGPDGADVGLVYIAVSSPERVVVRGFHLTGDRDTIRKTAAKIAVSLLVGELHHGQESNG